MEMTPQKGNEKENGKVEGESGAAPSQADGTPRMDLSEEEIERRIRIARLEEELRKQLERITKEKQQLEEKAKNAREKIFAEMQQRYSLTEEEFREAFKDIQRKEEIEKEIMETIKEKGKKACKDKEFKENIERIKRISIIENMEDGDVKRISIYIEEARRYIEEKQIAQGKAKIHHKGRLHEQTIEIMKMIRDAGRRMNERECLNEAKEKLGIDSDLFNKRRWTLFKQGYVRREGADLVITDIGLARLQEEGL